MIEVVLNTGSTVRQGAVIKGGRKMTDEYVKEAAYCDLNPRDMERLESPAKVKVHTEVGEVTVYARIDEGVSEGHAFIPRGPWANTIISSDTMGSGSPYYKGMKAWVEASSEEVLDTETLIKTYYIQGK
ncbi:MAG: molybdopterin dinucleotide binding domain-containing protein [Halobacteriota archaeon]